MRGLTIDQVCALTTYHTGHAMESIAAGSGLCSSLHCQMIALSFALIIITCCMSSVLTGHGPAHGSTSSRHEFTWRQWLPSLSSSGHAASPLSLCFLRGQPKPRVPPAAVVQQPHAPLLTACSTQWVFHVRHAEWSTRSSTSSST